MTMAEALAALLAQQKAMQFAAPEPDRPAPELPDISVRSLGEGAPQFGGAMGLPGGLSLHGQYLRPDPQANPDWSAMLKYRRQF